MNVTQLIPASQCARQFGVKALVHGGPGSGKTPIVKTAPRPVMLVCETGMLSMRDAHNIPCWEAFSVAKIKEFFEWFTKSHEAKAFDTLALDSVSQLAEIVLAEELPRNKDGRKAYGEMSRQVMAWMDDLFFMPSKHIYLISKQIVVDMSGVQTRKYWFPGQDLGVKLPHRYDEILCVGKFIVPGMEAQGAITAIQCQPSFDVVARDRSGRLAMYEPPDLKALFAKAMS